MSKILVVREYDEFSRILAENNFEIISLPLIETKTLDDLSDFEAKLAAIEIYDGIFITSQPATEILRAKIIEKNLAYRGRVYVLGKRGYQCLKSENLDLCYDEAVNTAQEMLEKIAPDNLASKRFLFVRGEKSSRVVPDFLSNIAEVDETIVYETRTIAIQSDEAQAIGAKIEKNEIVCACFFSPSAGASFIEQFGAAILHQTSIVTIGKTTAEFFAEQNLEVGFVSSKATAENFAIELIKHLRKDLPAKNTKGTKLGTI